MDFSALDHQALAAAVRRLEEASLAGRLAALAGKPVGLVQRVLPTAASTAVANATKRALERALEVALFSLKNPRLSGGRKLHSGLACASGAVGGAFGLPALAVELPVSTTIMLRGIAAIAQQEGEDLSDPRARLACLEVFALGGPVGGEQGSETDYFTVRAMLARGLGRDCRLRRRQGCDPRGSAAVRRLSDADRVAFWDRGVTKGRGANDRSARRCRRGRR
jgi:hypothetical protein